MDPKQIQDAAATIAELGARASAVDLVKLPVRELGGGKEVLTALVPQGKTLESIKPHLDAWLDRPRRKEGIAVLQTLESLIAHANRHKTAHSAAFIDRYGNTPKMLVVFDYHEKSEIPDGAETHAERGEGRPDWLRHRGRYDFPFSPEWLAWTNQAGKEMGQEAFAEFLEDRAVDLIHPDLAIEGTKNLVALLGLTMATPSRMVELSRGLALTENRRVQQAVSIGSGEMKISYATEHQGQDGAELKVPGAFLIAIPVFRAGDRFQVFVRLRYRVRSGAVSWAYTLERVDDVREVAIDEAIQDLQEGTGLPVFVGTPE